MTFDYTRVRGSAERLLARFGQVATLVKPGAMTGPEHDPVPGPATEHPITVVDENQMQRDQSGTLIGEAVHALIVSTSGGIAPERQDRVRLANGRDLEIIDVRPTAPGGVVLLFEVRVSG